MLTTTTTTPKVSQTGAKQHKHAPSLARTLLAFAVLFFALLQNLSCSISTQNLSTKSVSAVIKGYLTLFFVFTPKQHEKTHRVKRSITGHAGPVYACARAGVKGYVTAGKDGFVMLWDAELQKLKQVRHYA